MKNGKINCVVVKDLSRLGRNYIEVGNYIEQVFPLFNIRFIAINDTVDSFKNKESVNTILVPFKNLINDEYAKDTSVKIRTSLNAKKKKGEFVGAFSAYGYIKDPKNKHKLIIDEEAASIVKKIFDWNVNYGLGKITICHKLNDLGVLNPTGHKKIELGQNYNNYGIKQSSYLWTPSTIRNILNNEIYIGNTVQGKRRAKSYKVHKVEQIPKEEWIKVENTHEPIIDKEIFEKAQKLSKLDTKISQKTKELSIWAGLVKCADCKMAMNKKTSTNKNGNTYEYYICSTYKKKSNKMCTKHTIRLESLEKAVLASINYHISFLTDIEEIIKKVNENTYQNEENKRIEKNIVNKQNEITKLSNFKMCLYEDWKSKALTKEEYIEYKSKYENDIEKLKENIEKLKKEKQKYEMQKITQNEWLENFKKSKKITKLSRDILLELINSIYVHENGNITISFNFEIY